MVRNTLEITTFALNISRRRPDDTLSGQTVAAG
jgi:hypothetical protein